MIRLEIEEKVDKRLLKILKKELSVENEDIYEISGPLDLTFLMKLYGMGGFDHLKSSFLTCLYIYMEFSPCFGNHIAGYGEENCFCIR